MRTTISRGLATQFTSRRVWQTLKKSYQLVWQTLKRVTSLMWRPLLRKAPPSAVICQPRRQLRCARAEPCTRCPAPIRLRPQLTVNVRVRSPVAVLRPRRQRLRVAVVVRHKPIRRARLLRLAVSVAIAVAVLRLVRVRLLPVGRWGPADAAAATQGFVGGANGAAMGIPADDLSGRVRGRRRGPSRVAAARAGVASAL